VVVAHPDDHAFGVAALVALHGDDPGFRFVLVHATDGEAGQIAEGSGATRATLGAVRRQEDERAWRTLGRPPDRHEWFGYPDGGLAEAPYDQLVDRIATVLSRGAPRRGGHLWPGRDHWSPRPRHHRPGHDRGIPTLGRRRRPRAAPTRLRGDSPVDDRPPEPSAVAAGLQPWDPGTVYHLRGVPDDRIDIVIDTSVVAARVRAAMREHRTQWADMNPAGVPEAELEKNVSRETEVIAWPTTRPGRVLSDVFDEL
jgi:N-acetyl-1-D-myo-inositol-2-amino-2-deoxy-alpha-D-glucopyranoside deacetylase